MAGGILLLIPLCRISLRADRSALLSSVFRMSRDTTVVAAGDSHTETSICPDLLRGVVNISRSAESYFYTYYKLKHFLALNPQVKTVLLGYSPHNLANHDVQFRTDQLNQWKEYFILLDPPARRQVASFRLPYLVAFLQAEYGAPFRLVQNPILMKYLFRKPLNRMDFPFNGDYKPLTGSFVDHDKVDQRVAEHFLAREQYLGTSAFQARYLERIAELCSEKGIRLVLVSTPVTAGYFRGIPRQARADADQVASRVLKRFPTFRFCNLEALPVPTEGFYDPNHVNRIGARIVSERLLALHPDLFPEMRKTPGMDGGS
ncbi:hypothetical protein [Geomesophilobacter sediminis]|uniref:Uncharacterized protein n=1 Tax=Geomesophilobacter sediminis TaxID=2798584 RepID=A0A8J7INM0_9BACT|nr:hypothetical protein [Geomesophilobacter sediminis]MBJ6723694.1 hypothetical protein [Geomesophilobacter sediminis]